MRNETNVVDLVANAIRDLEELKSSQFFGADALKVNEWSGDISSSGSTIKLIKIKLTPTNNMGCLPVSVSLKFTPPSGEENARKPPIKITPKYSSSNFEWQGYYTDYIGYGTLSVLVQWIGEGTVILEQ